MKGVDKGNMIFKRCSRYCCQISNFKVLSLNRIDFLKNKKGGNWFVVGGIEEISLESERG